MKFPRSAAVGAWQLVAEVKRLSALYKRLDAEIIDRFERHVPISRHLSPSAFHKHMNSHRHVAVMSNV